MDLLSCCPFWPLKDGLPATYPPLERNVSTEVAIIGGGITGALFAWHLAEAGIGSIVVDRREIAHGSTAGSTALLQYELDVPLHRLEKQLGRDRARRAYNDCLGAVQRTGQLIKQLKIDCGYAVKGSVLLARNSGSVPSLRREFAARRAAGFPVDWWTRNELARRSSIPRAAAIFSHPGQAAQVDAYALTYGLLAAAVARGAVVHDRTTVTRHRVTVRGVELLTDRGARIRARWLVVAAGYEADRFLPRSVAALHSTYALASEPVADFPGWPAGLPLIWETGDPFLYLRTTEDHRIILGGCDEPFRNPVARDRLLARKVAALRRGFSRLFPHFPLEVATAWAGTFGKTHDGLPFMGQHPASPRTWFALGYGGNGIPYSLLAAELFRDFLATGVARDLDLYGFECRGE
jgi:glycine/D-amino acid oxidase-like deaminating enzyme